MRSEVQVDVAARITDGHLPARKGRRPVWSEERRAFVDAEVWDRYRMAPGARVHGPAVVEERESSAVIGPGGTGEIDAHGNLVVELPG